MCLITFAYKAHPTYKLILAANRDEFYARPTRAAQFWENENLPKILAGKDLEAGGTWMGLSKSATWSALTNFRDPANIKENAPSRGDLVLNFLKGNDSGNAYLSQVKKKANEYNGFNLLIGDRKNLYHFSNSSNKVTRIEKGVHGVSNAVLDTPWPKLDQAKSDLHKVIEEEHFTTEELFELLKNDQKAPDETLPKTGIPYEWEKKLSSVFIKTENYGTRCSTIMLIDYQGNAQFFERRYNPLTSEIVEENAFKLVFS